MLMHSGILVYSYDALLASYGLPVRVAFEATGNYHRAIAYHPAAAGFGMKLVSSVSLAHTRQALHYSWDKMIPRMPGLFCT